MFRNYGHRAQVFADAAAAWATAHVRDFTMREEAR
jgi:hypothetical protein